MKQVKGVGFERARACVLSFVAVVLLVEVVQAQGFSNVAPAQGISHSVNTDMSIGGAGVAFFDFDNDGWDDITFMQVNDSLVFYKNVNGNLQKLPSFIYSEYETKQLLWVDYDNDGDYDAFLVTYDGPCRLYQNNGNFEFTDVTLESGLEMLTFNLKNYGVTFADYDRDGHLDFYLARYVMQGDETNPLLQNALYRNNGDGTFTDVTETAGVANGLQPTFMGVWLDANNNGWPDLYVINDRVLWGNSLYINNGDGTFTDFTEQSGAGMFGEDPMCAAFADYDNDGDLDILCTNGGPPTKPPRLYRNNGNTTFTEVGQQLGIHVNETFMCQWGTSFIDVDNDSYLDLYMTTGLLLLDPTNEDRSYLFMSNEAQSFTDTPEMFDFNHVAASYSVGKGDLNNDGFADLVVSNAKNFDSFIWQNQVNTPNPNNYIKVTIEGTVSNTMAVGSWIHVYADGKAYHHYTRCGDSFVSQDSQHHIFGLGQATMVDSIVVNYSLGHTDVYYDLDVNQHVYLKEGEGYQASLSVSGVFSMCNGDTLILNAGDHTSYLWSNGSTEQHVSITESGSYWVQVQSEEGFVANSDTLVVVVNDNPEIDFTTTQPLCFGDDNGSINIENLLGIPPASVVWNNGMSGETIDNLVAGLYDYTFVDMNQCEAEGYILLQEPLPLSVQVFTFPETNGNDGGFNLLFNGGTPPYTVFLDSVIAQPIMDNLSSGEYHLLVVDTNGCTFKGLVIIEGTVGIVDVQNAVPLIYPNPTTRSGFVRIEWEPTLNLDKILVIDAVGKHCYDVGVPLGSGFLELDLGSKLRSSGTYRLLFYNQFEYIGQRQIIVLD
ncbi:MAG: CRTAC1 family protein [Cryomorphaceae bacterium]|nr:MAG: CRTAC1 family protein [Cryomorphaceae bacterium]